MNIGKSLKVVAQKTVYVLALCAGSLSLLVASDPFSTIEKTLEETQGKLSTISFIILGISFIYAAIVGAWLHRWRQALGVVVAGALIGLGPSIIDWVSKLK